MFERAAPQLFSLADAFTEPQDRVRTRAPRSLTATAVTIALAVDDDPAAVDDFYGRHGQLTGPFDPVWSFVGPKTGV